MSTIELAIYTCLKSKRVCTVFSSIYRESSVNNLFSYDLRIYVSFSQFFSTYLSLILFEWLFFTLQLKSSCTTHISYQYIIDIYVSALVLPRKFWVCFWMTVFWSSGPLYSAWTQVLYTGLSAAGLKTSHHGHTVEFWVLFPYFQCMEWLKWAIYSSDRERSCFCVGSICGSVGFLRHLNVFGLHGRSDETRASPELWRREGPACTALGQSGVRTRPFSPTLPVIDSRALFRMASVKVSYIRKRTKMQKKKETQTEKK